MNILQILFGLLTSGRLESLAKMFGVKTDAIEKALGAALPAILGGMISKGSAETGAAGLLKTLREQKGAAGLLDKLDDMFKPGQDQDDLVKGGASLLSGVFGEKGSAVSGLVSRFAGIDGKHVDKLLGLAAPMVMGGLARAEPKDGFTAASLMSMLAGQKEHVAKLAPPGVAEFLGGLPGMGGFAAMAATAAGGAVKKTTVTTETTVTPKPAAVAATAAAASAAPAQRGDNTPWWVLAALAVPMIFLGVRSCERTDTAAPAPVARAEPAPAVVEPPPPPAGVQRLALPGGQTIDVPEGSIGYTLFEFLKSGDPAPRTFVFDRLNFVTGSSNLTDDSRATVQAAAAVLKAFPQAELRVDGHTDNTGRRASNVALSKSRADSVMAMLVAEGVAASRLTSAGLGPDQPLDRANTDEARAKNRRVELTVTRK
jgi:OmpA-OmpF porin, OOP family